MNKKRGIPCIVIGIIVAALGFIPIISAIVIDNSPSFYGSIDNYYHPSPLINLPKILLISGAIMIFIGLMLLILGVVLYSTSANKYYSESLPAPENNNYNQPVSDTNAASGNNTANQCAVIDEVNCLTEYQKIGLLTRLSDFKSKTNYGIAIYIKHDDFTEQLYKSAYNYYRTKTLGQSCVILMLSAVNNNVFISAMGNCRRFINDQTKERIYGAMLNYCRGGQYYDACIEYIDSVLDCVSGAKPSNPSPQFNSFNPAPEVPNEPSQPVNMENVNPYDNKEPQTCAPPVQPDEPINSEFYQNPEPVQPVEPITTTPYQPEEQINPYANEASDSVEADTQPMTQSNNFCTVCGAPIEKDGKFCTQCGNRID